MKIGVLGSGIVGQVLSAKLAEVRHDVMLGTREVARLMERRESYMGQTQSFAEWHKQYPEVRLGTFAEAAGHGELVMNATSGTASLDALGMAGEANLSGKILIDIGNPLDSSRGMPPSLSVSNTDSLGEQIQRAFPQVKVVKTLNTVNAYVMANPQLVAGGDHQMFVAGNDPAAKAEVSAFLKEAFGWKHIMDLGDITAARGMEMYLPLWLRLWGTVRSGMFNIKVVSQ